MSLHNSLDMVLYTCLCRACCTCRYTSIHTYMHVHPQPAWCCVKCSRKGLDWHPDSISIHPSVCPSVHLSVHTSRQASVHECVSKNHRHTCLHPCLQHSQEDCVWLNWRVCMLKCDVPHKRTVKRTHFKWHAYSHDRIGHHIARTSQQSPVAVCIAFEDDS